MIELKIVTTNSNKFSDFKKCLADIAHLEQLPIELQEVRDIDSEAVCREKLKEAHRLTGEKNIVVEDRGFYIEDLNGFPGSYIKLMSEIIGVERLAKLVGKNKSCHFKYALGYLDENQNEHVFVGKKNL